MASKSSVRPVALALVLVLISATASGVLARRLEREFSRTDRLDAKVQALQNELDDLRSRLTTDTSGSILDRILRAVSKLRGLSILRGVKAEVLTDAELRRRVLASINSDNPRPQTEASGKVLQELGLLGPHDDLFKILSDVEAEQVGGYYDSKTKQMVVGGDAANPTPFDRVLLAHEYTHALADQHFGLSRLGTLSTQGKDDEAEAFLGLTEGDATFLMGEYAREVLTASEKDQYLQQANNVHSPILDAAPKAVQDSLLFPYVEGTKFVQALFEHGGNAAIDRAYKDPPTSTEQIMHPEKYYQQRDDPTAVTTPDLARSMGSGWKPLDTGGLGEFDMKSIYGRFLTEADASSGAAGWDGGRYVAIEGSSGVLIAGVTAWDSNTEAREATQTFDDWLPKRFPDRGVDRRIAGLDGRAWESANGAGIVVRAGDKMLFVLGPDSASVDRARAAFPAFSTAV